MQSFELTTTGEEQRHLERVSVDALTVVTSGRRQKKARLHNISAGGALVGPMFDVNVGDRCEVAVPGYGGIGGVVCRVTRDNDVAVCFDPDREFLTFCEDTRTLIASIQTGSMAFERPRSIAG